MNERVEAIKARRQRCSHVLDDGGDELALVGSDIDWLLDAIAQAEREQRGCEGALADAATVPTDDVEAGIRALIRERTQAEREREELKLKVRQEVWDGQKARAEVERLTTAQSESQHRVLKVMQGLYHALVGIALHGVDDENGEPTAFQAFCDDGWLCEHAECVAARDAMQAADQETSGTVRSRAALEGRG